MEVYELINELKGTKAGLKVKVNVILSVNKLKELLREAKAEGFESNSVFTSLTGSIFDINDEEIIFESLEE